jgi:transcription initiation factor IIE alpha subunit
MDDYTVFPARLWKLRSLNKTALLMIPSLYYCHQKHIKTSRKSLARVSGWSLSAVHKSLNKLETLGFIVKETHKDEDGGHLPSTYTINVDAIQAACQERG